MTASGTEEPFPGTPTLSFYGSCYNSRYIAFSPIEQWSDVPSPTASALLDCDGYKPLQSLSSTARRTFLRYDYPPYVSSAYEGTIPSWTSRTSSSTTPPSWPRQSAAGSPRHR